MYPKIDVKATGNHIRQIMDRQGITVKDVQKYMNFGSVQSIYHWLNGRSLPTVDNLYALAELFHMPMDAILIGDRKHYRTAYADSFYRRMRAYYILAGKMYAA